MVVLAVPCTDDSIATGMLNRSDERVRDRRQLIRFVVRVLEVCLENNTLYIIENPRFSRLWKRPIVSRALRLANATSTPYECCPFGTTYKKAQLLRSNVPGIEQVGLRCECEVPHEHLDGKVQLVVDGRKQWFWKTTLAGRYPPSFCWLHSDVVHSCCPSGGRSGLAEQVFHPFWTKQLSDAIHCSVDAPPTPTCPLRTEPNEWQRATDFAIEGPSRLLRAAAVATLVEQERLSKTILRSQGSNGTRPPRRRGRRGAFATAACTTRDAADLLAGREHPPREAPAPEPALAQPSRPSP